MAEGHPRQGSAARSIQRLFGAGASPKGAVQSASPCQLLQSLGYPRRGAFARRAGTSSPCRDAPTLDFVFTVCDDAAGETCPVWPGHPMTAHWGVEDPAKVEGSEVEKEAAFARAFKYLKNRISVFINLPIGSLDRADALGIA